MKLKKILVLGLFLGIVLCPNVSIAKDYACEFDNGGYYRYSPDISDEEYKQRCETYKNPFWGEKRQQLYENCLEGLTLRCFANGCRCALFCCLVPVRLTLSCLAIPFGGSAIITARHRSG